MKTTLSISKLRQVMMQPERLTAIESWHRHIPFAFALLDLAKPDVYVELGTHRGDSYSAFCQGVLQQQLPTRCYAVDTWQGDEHAGEYSSEVYDDLVAWHHPRYSSFSSLLRMTFDEALAQFPDGSVDVLHIDGLHTYDAVKHDFESWLPKMSQRGVVLFHDTNVRHGDFAVWQLWAEIAEQYPSFEFPFGFGLGVLAVGTEVPAGVLEFLDYAQHNSQEVIDFFYAQGDAAQVRKSAAQIQRLQYVLDATGKQLSHAMQVVEQRDAALQELHAAKHAAEHNMNSARLQFERSLRLLAERENSLIHSEQQLRERDTQARMVLNSPLWRVRNKLMQVLGRSARAMYYSPASFATVTQADTVLSTIVLPEPPSVTIVIPVYGGCADTQRCIEAVLASSYNLAVEVVVINDASPEPELVEWLLDNEQRFTLLHNTENLGFVATVNRGMALYPHNDVVLVNSDTQVSNDWLDRMQAAAYSAERIGSVTPFSNNATICSYPILCADNELPEGYSPAELDRVFAEVNAGQVVDIPTAVGFCMFIRRDCLNDAGAFDAELFGRGYGEENEFCMRSAARGWRHVLTGDTFVYHKGGVSFAQTQSEHQRHGHQVLTHLYPQYDAVIQQHIAENPARMLRFAVDVELEKRSALPMIVIVNHCRGGGTERHVVDLATQLAAQAHVYLLTPEYENGPAYLRSFAHPQRPGLAFDPHTQMPQLIATLRWMGVARLHYHHTIGMAPPMLLLPESLPCSYDMTVHDYYLACPQVTLVDEQGRYCGAPDVDGCNACLAKRPAPDAVSIEQWRELGAQFLNAAERVFVPSTDTLQRMCSYFPAANFVLAEHEPDLRPAVVQVQPRAVGEPLRILVLGALSVFKGADVLEACAIQARAQRAPLEFHLLGFAYRKLRTRPFSHLQVYGAYEDAELAARIADIAPHVVWFPGSCPETHSYTLSAVLAAGLPVIASNIGAFPERLAGREWTWLVQPDRSTSEILTHLLEVQRMLTQDSAPNLIPLMDVAKANFAYATDYVAGIAQPDHSTAAKLNVHETWQGLAAPQGNEAFANVRFALVRKALPRVLHNPLLGSLVARMPYSLKQNIKKMLLS